MRSVLKIDYDFDSGIKLRSVTRLSVRQHPVSRPISTAPATANFTFCDTVDEATVVAGIQPDLARRRLLTWCWAPTSDDRHTTSRPCQFDIGLPPGSVFTEYLLQGTNPSRHVAVFGQVGFNLTPSLELQVGGRYTAARTTNHVACSAVRHVLITHDQSANYSKFLRQGVAELDRRRAQLSLRLRRDRLPAGRPERAGGSRPAGAVRRGKGHRLRSRLEEQLASTGICARSSTASTTTTRTSRSSSAIRVPDLRVRAEHSQHDQDLRRRGPGRGGVRRVLVRRRRRHGCTANSARFFATDPRVAGASRAVRSRRVRPGQRHPASTSTGNDQTYAPELHLQCRRAVRLPLGGGDTLTPRVNFGHVSQQWATLFENPALGDRIEERNILNAQLAWTHDDIVTTLYGTNLTDQHYVGGAQFRPPLRRPAAPVRHPRDEGVLDQRHRPPRCSSSRRPHFLLIFLLHGSCSPTPSRSTNFSITPPSGRAIARSSRPMRASGVARASAMPRCARAAIGCRARCSSLGLQLGDRVGTLAWNTQHHLEMYYAAMGAGLVCHTLNPRLTHRASRGDDQRSGGSRARGRGQSGRRCSPSWRRSARRSSTSS